MSRTVLEDLMKRIVPIAERLLEQHGTFVPFGGALDREDKVDLAGGKSEDSYGSSREILETVIGQLKTYADDGSHTAVAMVLDVRVTPPGKKEETDAIRAVLEHETGLNMEAFIPYAKNPEGEIEYDEMFVFPGKAKFFTK
jgi:hypothetical protein